MRLAHCDRCGRTEKLEPNGSIPESWDTIYIGDRQDVCDKCVKEIKQEITDHPKTLNKEKD